MTKVTVGRYALRQYGSIFFASDAFWDSNSGVFGVASSTHSYDLYPIAERDVQAAFEIIKKGLPKSVADGLTGVDLLQGQLQAINQGFTEIDLRTHIAGIEFHRSSKLPKPINDPEARPLVKVILLQLKGQQLYIASIKGFLVYVIRQEGQELVFGWDWFRHERVIVGPDWPGPFIAGRSGGLKASEIYSLRTEVKPGDLIVVATESMSEVIAAARLNQLVRTSGYDSEAIGRHLMHTLKSIAPEDSLELMSSSATKSRVRMWGAAWAIARVGE